MSSQNQGNTLQDILKWEEENRHSREIVTVLSGQNLSMGEVIGKVTKSIPTTGTPDGGNTGQGSVTGVSGGKDAKLGVYTLECVATASGGGTFKVTAPDGDALPDAVVGTAYVNEQINFTINDGDPDFSLGDKFTIEVAAGSRKVTAIDLDAVDGSREACGFVIADYDASLGDVEGVAIVRNAVIVPDDLVWPDGATTDQKAQALAELKAKGIVTRSEA
jgi:hypothetical protein